MTGQSHFDAVWAGRYNAWAATQTPHSCGTIHDPEASECVMTSESVPFSPSEREAAMCCDWDDSSAESLLLAYLNGNRNDVISHLCHSHPCVTAMALYEADERTVREITNRLVDAKVSSNIS